MFFSDEKAEKKANKRKEKKRKNIPAWTPCIRMHISTVLE